MILLGLVQGLTEFLPVSSSGHLVLADHLIGVGELGVREVVVLHLGTLIAMLHFFRRELLLLAGVRRRPEPYDAGDDDFDRNRLVLLLGAGTVVTVALALTARKAVTAALDSLLLVGLGLFVTATVLLLTAGIARRREGRGLGEVGLRDALCIGLAQGIAVWPGVSRSGITIAAGLMCGLRQEQAARFSFLLAFPIILGAAAEEILSAPPAADPQTTPLPALLLGAAVAAMSGWIALRILFGMFRRTTLAGFAYYCLGAGVLAFLLHFAA